MSHSNRERILIVKELTLVERTGAKNVRVVPAVQSASRIASWFESVTYWRRAFETLTLPLEVSSYQVTCRSQLGSQ